MLKYIILLIVIILAAAGIVAVLMSAKRKRDYVKRNLFSSAELSFLNALELALD